MRQSWYIFGAGGLGLEVLDILAPSLTKDYEAKFLLDSQYVDSKKEMRLHNIQVTAMTDELVGYVTVAVGEPAARELIYQRLLNTSLLPRSIISVDAVVSRFSTIGNGCIISPMCSIQSTAVLKDNVAVNTAAIIGHDVVVERSCVISSQVNLGGGVKVGKESYIGMGALIREGVTIGNNVIIGMGSVVHKNVPDGVIAMGNPARVLKKNIDKKIFN